MLASQLGHHVGKWVPIGICHQSQTSSPTWPHTCNCIGKLGPAFGDPGGLISDDSGSSQMPHAFLSPKRKPPTGLMRRTKRPSSGALTESKDRGRSSCKGSKDYSCSSEKRGSKFPCTGKRERPESRSSSSTRALTSELSWLGS